MLLGDGTHDTHSLTLHSGKPNPSRDAGQPYRSISWDEIRGLAEKPAAESKTAAPFTILSTYVEHDGRTHDAQREHGEYWGLAADVDKGSPSLAAVEAAMRAVAPGASGVIYSSSSASKDEMKWRGLLELSQPIPGADYQDTQEALFELLAAQGIQCDPTLARTGQPIFLPNVPPKRRGPDGRPAFYQSLQLSGRPLELSPESPIIKAREALRARRDAEAAEAAARAEAAREARRAYIKATGDDFDPVENFNATTPLGPLMAEYKFTKHSRKKGDYRSPLSESRSYSTRILASEDGSKEYWVAFSAWAHAHNVGRKTAKGNRTGDAFDLFVHFKHDGDRRAAVMAHVREAKPDLFAALQSDPKRRDKFLAWAASVWRVRSAAIDSPANQGPARSIEEIRQEIAEELAAALRQPESIHLFRPATGTGKTTLALQAAQWSCEAALEQAYRWDKELAEAEAGGGYGATCPWPKPRKTAPWGATCPWPRARPLPTDFTISLPTHANVREVERAAGRLELNPGAFPERNEHNCGNIEKAAKAAAMGLNAFSAVCQSCHLATKCRESGYLAGVKEANESTFKIGTHGRAVVSQKMTEKSDAIIIDEDPAKALAPTYSADIADITKVLLWCRSICQDLRLDGQRVVEVDDEQRIFAEHIEEIAGRILDAVTGIRVVEAPLSPEQEAAAQAEKDDAIRWRCSQHDEAIRRKDSAKAEVARIEKRLKKVAGNPELVAVLKEQAAAAKATLKSRSKLARATGAALRRISRRALTTFPAGRPSASFCSQPDSRVTRIDIPTEVSAPENWSAMVFRWAERYGVGNAINPEARKIVMLAATGGLEDLFVVRAEEERTPGHTHHYVFAKGKTAIPRDRVVIALDATADAEALRAMTGLEVIDHTPAGHIPLVHDATQITIDLTASTSPSEAAKVVEAILERFPEKRRIGLIGWRKAILGMTDGGKLSEPARARIAKTAYFWEGPDRGSNDWIKPVEDGGAGCDLLIVLGTPRPGTEPVRKMLISMGLIEAACLPDGDWGPRRWQGQRADGRAVTVEAIGYRHPDWHRAYCLIVRAMLTQAIGRARASLPEGIPVVAVTVEPTGLPAGRPLPLLGAEIRETTDLARSLTGMGGAKRNAIYIPIRERIALRGWLRTADLIAALTEPGAVCKQSRKPEPGLSKRAAVIRIRQAVAAGCLVRGPIRGWVGIAGDCDPWPSAAGPAADDSLLEQMDERAAILEYDGGYEREAAERLAAAVPA